MARLSRNDGPVGVMSFESSREGNRGAACSDTSMSVGLCCKRRFEVSVSEVDRGFKLCKTHGCAVEGSKRGIGDVPGRGRY
ncbi:hypothetical protein DPMN_123169 [Dreissena polymorpha]|uniref:Uncharacterized protein n=1 Tax=Dreissena polymorpha TaxID=45954 RepID=A0A9D4JR14_DREPO|nr:hypothetical protein DPMN_123169 [Dreissena polymorpha]